MSSSPSLRDSRGKPLPQVPLQRLNTAIASRPTITVSSTSPTSNIPSRGDIPLRDEGMRSETVGSTESLMTFPEISSYHHADRRPSRSTPGPVHDGRDRSPSPTPMQRAALSPETPSSMDAMSPLSSVSGRSQHPRDVRSGSTPATSSRAIQPMHQRSRSQSFLHQPYVDSPISDYTGRKSSSSGFSDYDYPRPQLGCPSKRSIFQRPSSFLPVMNMILAVYATILSGIWLAVAVVKPRYGNGIHSHGALTPAAASSLSALFAKTIELSSTTVFVTMLGQVFSRRAFQRAGKGITIAEMTMRSWIMQPGTLLTHWGTVRYAYISFLGVIGLTTALMTMLYTTASDALVSPSLQFGPWEPKTLTGNVKTTYANPIYVADKCLSPTKDIDPEYGGSTCVQIEHAGQSFHNYLQFLETWTNVIGTGNGSDTLRDIKHRPDASALLFDNTTVQGSWVEARDMKETSTRLKRRVNNVTLAMPHPGVWAAAVASENDILQPDELAGMGEYHIRASVPSPAVNVMCVAMSAAELSPLIYEEWPGTRGSFDPAEWNTNPLIPGFADDEWLNATVVDDIFRFGEKYRRRPPIFPKLPIDFNTLLNGTMPFGDSLYLLGKSAVADPPYSLCSLRSSLSPNCSTTYHATQSGGELASHCEDVDDSQAYYRSHPEAPIGLVEKDWKNVATDWGAALALGAGNQDANASNARLLTQLIPTKDELDPSSPSIAEALAAMAGYTLLLSAQDAPLVHSWNYSKSVNVLTDPQSETFSASVRTQQYASGGTQKWQGIFYIVLGLVFFTNVFCLTYALIKTGLVTDFTEPENLFTLAINSPPSRRMAGSCGAGPHGDQFKVNWFVNVEGEHVFIENGEEPVGWRRKADPIPISSIYRKLSASQSNFP
ncbi:MAG: hypothetical protein M1825_003705 [Sarcosagium campestre]|nr:MAG: hypothetical protein M1825_003705 [Sarcosagium campestre]